MFAEDWQYNNIINNGGSEVLDYHILVYNSLPTCRDMVGMEQYPDYMYQKQNMTYEQTIHKFSFLKKINGEDFQKKQWHNNR